MQNCTINSQAVSVAAAPRVRLQYSVSAIFVCIAVSHQKSVLYQHPEPCIPLARQATGFKAGLGAGLGSGSQIKGGYSSPSCLDVRPHPASSFRCCALPGRAGLGAAEPAAQPARLCPLPLPLLPAPHPPHPKGSRSVCCIPGAAGGCGHRRPARGRACPFPCRLSGRCGAPGGSGQR